MIIACFDMNNIVYSLPNIIECIYTEILTSWESHFNMQVIDYGSQIGGSGTKSIV